MLLQAHARPSTTQGQAGGPSPPRDKQGTPHLQGMGKDPSTPKDEQGPLLPPRDKQRPLAFQR